MKYVVFIPIFVLFFVVKTNAQVASSDYPALISNISRNIQSVLSACSEAAPIVNDIASVNNYILNKSKALPGQAVVARMKAAIEQSERQVNAFISLNKTDENSNLKKLHDELNAASTEIQFTYSCIINITTAENSDQIKYFCEKLIRSLDEIKLLIGEASQYVSLEIQKDQ